MSSNLTGALGVLVFHLVQTLRDVFLRGEFWLSLTPKPRTKNGPFQVKKELHNRNKAAVLSEFLMIPEIQV